MMCLKKEKAMLRKDCDFQKKVLETDVLVIGAGGAGLRAAIEASRTGARVLVVAKGDFPSGCTAISMGGMLASFAPNDSKQIHLQDILSGGDYLNEPHLVKLLTEYACNRTEDLEKFGTIFRKNHLGYVLFHYTGSSVPRAVVADRPYAGGFANGLVEEIGRRGIQVIPRVMIFDLIKEKGAVVGAAGLDLESDTMLSILAGSTILATGGAGNLYRLTTNPADITGDGYALAYRAGARLQDMEFVQGRVCIVAPAGMRGTPPPGDGLVTQGGKFYNSLCERFMKYYHPDNLEKVTRAQMSICAQKEINKGKHTANKGVYGDLSDVPKEELNRYERFINACADQNFDPSWQPYEWAPGVHHFMGGVCINDKCETGVSGLFAAGEVVGGIHGSNRLGGNALTETQVFGAIAGKQAAQRVLLLKNSSSLPPNYPEYVEDRLLSISKREENIDPAEVREELTGTMSDHVGVIRNEDGLRKASDILKEIRETKIQKLSPKKDRSFQTLSELIAVENLHTVGELVVSAALMRKETRGAHIREDYPKIDNNWQQHIVFYLEGDLPCFEFVPVGN
jgi:fumarate reductase (CoM/CoB) subunit A